MDLVMNLEILFEEIPAISGFDDELLALRTGAKPMSVFPFALDDLGTDDPDPVYRELIEFAAENGLLVVHQPQVPEGRMFIVQADQLWRVQAYMLQVEAHRKWSGWSDADEVLRSRLLGYSEESISEWLLLQRRFRVRWGLATLYLIVDETTAGAIAGVNCRRVPPSVGSVTMFEYSGEGIVRRDASRLLGHARLARVGLTQRSISAILRGGDQRVPDLRVRIVANDELEELNAVMETRIEFLEDGEWR